MAPQQNKYASNSQARKELIEKRKQQKREQMAKQKEAQLKASIVLAIVAISVQAIAFIFTFLPGDKGYIILPGILGLLIGGMAIGLVHTDKKKKTFVTVIFIINVVIGFYSGIIFIKSQQVTVTKEDIENLHSMQSTFQEKLRAQEIKDSLQQVQNIQQIDTTLDQ